MVLVFLLSAVTQRAFVYDEELHLHTEKMQNLTGLGQLVQTVPAYLGSLSSSVASMHAKA